jgi:hypothetical protein
MEDEDFYTLQNPESYVIEKNGEIFFALYDQESNRNSGNDTFFGWCI